MYPRRNLLLLAGMAVAAFAMSTTSASAQDSNVANESSGEHCNPAFVLCETSLHGEEATIVRAHLVSGPEVISSTCTDEFRMIVTSENGEGIIDHQVFGGGGGCPNKPCEATTASSENGDPWPFHMHESQAGPHEFGMDVDFCLQPTSGSTQRHCIIEVGFNETEMPHNYEFEAEGLDGDGVPCGPGSTAPPVGVRVLEIDGHWLMEGEEIEIEHIF